VTSTAKRKKTITPLTPSDRKQCQAEIPNGVNFMTLGGRLERVRCKSTPTVIVTEVVPGTGDTEACRSAIRAGRKRSSNSERLQSPLNPS
jgi:hypothetical protein